MQSNRWCCSTAECKEMNRNTSLNQKHNDTQQHFTYLEHFKIFEPSDFGKLHKTREGASFRELETSWGRQCLQCKTFRDSSGSFIERACNFATSFQRVDWIAGVSTEPGGLHPTFLLSRAAHQSAWAKNAEGRVMAHVYFRCLILSDLCASCIYMNWHSASYGQNAWSSSEI